MKVILSRKGCDSDFGGIPSIILPDGRILYIPIPGEQHDTIRYKDVYGEDDFGNIADIVGQVAGGIRLNGKKIKMSDNVKCHLDPDINVNAYPRKEDWRGCFGQADASQTVLRKAGVGKGDLFLFFGWFNKTYIKNGKLHYCKGQGFHMIFGWLQIEEILYTAQHEVPEWLKYHPHTVPRCLPRPSNCIYIGSSYLSWDHNKRGYGIFRNVQDSLILTKEGETRSKWKLPEDFKGISITYHKETSWKDNYFQSAYRGQEFVFEENTKVENWAKKMIEDSGC